MKIVVRKATFSKYSFLLITIVLFNLIGAISVHAESQALNSEEKVLAHCKKFVLNLRNYINAQSLDADIFLENLYSLIEEPIVPHFNDLPASTASSRLEFHRYFSLIDDQYRGQLEMGETFPENIIVDDCIERKDGNIYYTVIFPKTYIYKGNTTTVKSIIKVNYKNNRPIINTVGMIENFGESDCKTSNSTIAEKMQDIQTRIQNYTTLGDQAFENGNYVQAIDYYQYAQKLERSNVQELKSKIDKCYQRIDADKYKEAGDRAFKNKEYSTALEYYEKSQSLNPNDAFTSTQVRKCHDYLNEYNRLIRSGDDAFERRQYNTARKWYKKANGIVYSVYCNQRIQECQLAIDYPRLVEEELSKARLLRKKRKHVEALALFNKHKGSDKLSSSEWLYLGQALYGNFKSTQRRFGYSRGIAMSIALEYLDESAKMGNKDARNFLNTFVSQRALRMINR